MTTRSVGLAFAVLFLIASLALAKESKTGSQAPSKETLEKLAEAWSSMDTSKIAPYYSSDPHNAYFDVAPLKYDGWAEWGEGVNKLFSDYKTFNVTLSGEPQIHMHGNLAWATYLWHIDAERKTGAKETFDGRDTTVWEKQNGKWLIVHEHDSVPLPTMAAPESK